jgi:arsenite transporter
LNTTRQLAGPASAPPSFLERHLVAFTILAILQGCAICIWAPSAETFLEGLRFGQTNIPIAVGLIVMMYPSLAKIRFEEIGSLVPHLSGLRWTLLQHWLLGPLLMTLLATLFLRNEPEYAVGLILIGLARGLGGISVWTKLAEGDQAYANSIVTLNALFQLVLYPLLAWFFVSMLPPLIGMGTAAFDAEIYQYYGAVAIYLGIPLAIAVGVRLLLVKWRGREWYEASFVPCIAPLRPAAILFTSVVIFSLKTDELLAMPLQLLQVGAPLAIYFCVMFLWSFFSETKRGASYSRTSTIAISSASSNIELAVAMAVTLFGIDSAQAFATVAGPLVEIPAMVGCVSAAWYFQRRYFSAPEGMHRLPAETVVTGSSRWKRPLSSTSSTP